MVGGRSGHGAIGTGLCSFSHLVPTSYFCFTVIRTEAYRILLQCFQYLERTTDILWMASSAPVPQTTRHVLTGTVTCKSGSSSIL